MQDQLVGWRKDRKTIFESFGASIQIEKRKTKKNEVILNGNIATITFIEN